MPKWRIWVSLIIIVALSWVEHQYVSESDKSYLSEATRKILHFVFYFLVTATGYFSWYKHPLKWLKKLWLISYIFTIIALLALWVIASRLHLQGVLDYVHNVMEIFISPIPFLILLVFSNMKTLTTK